MTPQGNGRSVLVTGASRGLGMATASALSQAGWRVIAGARDPSGVVYDDPSITVVPLDVTDHATVRSAVDAAQDIAGGALDAVVNNAGYALLGPLETLDMDDIRVQFETNVFGALAVTQAALPAMRAAGGGRILFVSSVGAHLSTPMVGLYRATKAAVNAMADTLRVEVRPFGIRILCIEPGMVDTGFSASAQRDALSLDSGPWATMATQTVGGLRKWREWVNLTADQVAGDIVGLLDAEDPPDVQLIGEDSVHLASLSQSQLMDFLGVDGTVDEQ